jgi:hypothetical protein
VAADRRSTPNVSSRSLSDLYPSSLDSDPSELKEQVSSLLTRHARAHDRHVTHASSLHERLTAMEETVTEMNKKLVGELSELKATVVSGFADSKLEKAVEQTRTKTAVAVLAFVWSVLSIVGGAGYQYLTKPTCKPDEALVSGACVPVTVTLKQ